MTTLATAAVQVVAETDGFDDDLRHKVTDAGKSADRAAKTVGEDLGTTLSQSMARSLVRIARNINTALVQVGKTARTALTASAQALGRLRDGFLNADAAASVFSGRMGTLGGKIRAALAPGEAALAALAEALGRMRDGFQDANAAVSVFSGRMGTLGGQLRKALDPGILLARQLAEALGRVRDGFQDANAAASAFSGRLGTLGGQIRKALDPGILLARYLAEALGRVRDGFQDARVAASAFSGVMGTLGGQARKALNPLVSLTSRVADLVVKLGVVSVGPLGRFRDGFQDARVAASAFSGVMGTLGGQARRATDAISGLFRELDGGDFTTFDKITANVSKGLSGIGRAAGGVLRGMGKMTAVVSATAASLSLMAGVSASLMTILPALGSLLGSTSTFLLGGGLATVGIIAAAQAEQVQDAFADMAEHVVDTFTGISGPIEKSLVSLSKNLSGLTDALAPSFEIGFADMGPALTRFFSEVTGPRGLGSWGPMIETLSAAFADMLDVVGPALAGALSRLGDAIARMAQAADPQAFAGFLAGAIDLISWLFDLFTILALVREEISQGMAPALKALEPFVDGLKEGFSTAGAAIRDFHRKYLSSLVDAIVAASPLMEEFGRGFSSAGGLIESFLDDISPVLGAIEPFVAGFTSGFIATRQAIGDALGLLLDLLGPAEGGLRGFAEWVGENETLMKGLGTAVGGIVAAFTAYRLVALGVALANTLVSKSFTAIKVGIRSIPVIGWIITAITLLAIGIQQLWKRSETFRDVVTGAWSKVTSVFEGAGERVGTVLTSFREGWDRLVNAAQGDGGIARVWEGIQDAVSTAWGVVKPIFDQLATSFKFVLGLISGDTSFSDIGEVISAWFGNLDTIGTNIGGFLIRQLQRLPGIVLGGLSWLGDTLGPWLVEQLKKLPGKAMEGLAALGTTISDWFQGLPDRIEEFLGVTDGWGTWFADLGATAITHLQGVGEDIAKYMKGIPDLVRKRIGDGARILEWLKDLPGKIAPLMREYGPKILKGLAIAIGIVVLGVPALLLGLLASILFVLGVIAWELIQWAWGAFTSMMEEAGRAISEGISSVVEWFRALPERILLAVVNLGVRLYTWGVSALAQLRSSFTEGLSNLLGSWRDTWTNLRSSAASTWSGIVSWVTTQAQKLYTMVMRPINALKDAVIAAFEAAREGVESAWGLLKEAVATPIEWVVNTAYNEWIRGVWGKVADKFDGPTLPSYTVKFAKGGIFPGNGGGVFSGYTPGRDVHAMPMAAFSGGESVLRPEVTKAWGAKTTLMLNRLAQSGGVKAVRRALAMLFAGHNPFTGMSVPTANPAVGGGGFAQRFAKGGILGAVTGRLSGVASWLNSTKEFSEGMFQFMDDPSGTLRKLLDQVMDYTQMPGWGSDWTDLLTKVPKNIIELLAKQAEKLFSLTGMVDWAGIGGSIGKRIGAAIAFARAQQGKPYIWGGVGPRGYDCSGIVSAVHNVLVGQNPYRRRYTTHPFTGRAFGGYIRNLPSPLMIGVTHSNVGHMSGTLAGKYNFESRGSRGAVFGSAARGWRDSLYSHRYGLASMGRPRNSKMGGEGLLYDSGGTLWPGTYLVSNKTGKPESIRTYAQEERVSRLVRAVERQTAQVARSPLVPVDRIGALERALGVHGRDRGRDEDRARVYAPITVNTVASDPAQVARKVVDRLVIQAGV